MGQKKTVCKFSSKTQCEKNRQTFWRDLRINLEYLRIRNFFVSIQIFYKIRNELRSG